MDRELFLYQQSPIFLAPGTHFMEDSFSTDSGGNGLGMIQAITFTVDFISEFHLRSSGTRSWRLGIPAIDNEIIT